jgi:hypothetical protein
MSLRSAGNFDRHPGFLFSEESRREQGEERGAKSVSFLLGLASLDVEVGV